MLIEFTSLSLIRKIVSCACSHNVPANHHSNISAIIAGDSTKSPLKNPCSLRKLAVGIR